jgi:nicotinamidase-related amidase
LTRWRALDPLRASARSHQRLRDPLADHLITPQNSALILIDYQVYPVVDAIGGTSVEAHRAGLERVAQAGAHPVSWVALACELQRDWAREETVPGIVEIVLTERRLQE